MNAARTKSKGSMATALAPAATPRTAANALRIKPERIRKKLKSFLRWVRVQSEVSPGVGSGVPSFVRRHNL
jgi:hypothetical protein